jgi:hypothetical protein
MNATSFEELKEMARGEVIPLTGFIANKPFNVRVKRVSILGLVQNGTIPNTLLGAANELFYGKNSNKSSGKDADMKELAKIMTLMAESALLEPTADQLKELSLELTDQQVVELFNYTQKGLEGIAKFPTDTKDNVSADDGKTLQDEAKSDNQSK